MSAVPRASAAGALRLLLWVAFLGAALLAVNALGTGALAPPQLTEPSTWTDWAARREPLDAVFAVMRLVVLALGWYLVGCTALGVVARMLRWGRLIALADLLTVPAVRGLLQSALGLGLATAALAGISAEPEPVEPARAPTAAAIALAQTRDATTVVAGGEAYGVMRSLDGGDRAVMRVVGEDAAVAQLSAGTGVTWEVQPGEHFWGLAERVLAESWGRPASDAEVVGYWQQVVEANRGALADPGNPDLVYPGQVFAVPAPPRAPV